MSEKLPSDHSWVSLFTAAKFREIDEKHFATQYQCEFRWTEKNRKLHEYAKSYHEQTEAFDRTVCTGPIVNGSIMAATTREAALSSRNARRVRGEIALQAVEHGISSDELNRAIRDYA